MERWTKKAALERMTNNQELQQVYHATRSRDCSLKARRRLPDTRKRLGNCKVSR